MTKSADDTDEISISLEAPPTQEPGQGLAGNELFGADSFAMVSCKLHIAEAFLRLAAKDCKFNDFAREMMLTAMKVVQSEAASLLEYDPAANEFFFRSVAGTSSDKVATFRIPMGQGIVGHVGESKQTLVVSNMEQNAVHLKTIDDAVGFTTRNVIAVPILVRGQLYGVLELLNRVGEGSYTKQDVEIVNYLAEMAAKALELRFMMAWALGTATKGEAA